LDLIKLDPNQRKRLYIKHFANECKDHGLVGDETEKAALIGDLESSNIGVVAQDALVSLGLEIAILLLNPMLATAFLYQTGGDLWLAAVSNIAAQGIIRGPYMVYRAAEETRLFRDSNSNPDLLKNTLYHTSLMTGGFIPIVGVGIIPFLSSHRNKLFAELNIKLLGSKLKKKLPKFGGQSRQPK
jgi:hypothetical protein